MGGDGDVPGIRYAAVLRFFREHLALAGDDLAFELIGAGRSNLTYRVTGDGRTWVLRRPPLGHVLPTAHDMGREYRVLRALALYKLAVISEGIYARHLQGKTVGEGFAGMTRAAGALADRALAIADTAADRRLREG